MAAFVSGLATTPVKSTRIGGVERIELDASGARGDRAFCVIDERDRMVNAKVFSKLMTVLSGYDVATGQLTLTFPDGSRADGEVRRGETLTIEFFRSPLDSRLVIGPWAEALSQYIGAPLRLVEPEVGVDRGAGGAISIVSRASLTDLASVAHNDSVDVRRFRMLIEIDGVTPYEEDSWVGHELAVGDARVAIRGNVGRCAVTTRDPDSAQVNFPTLKLLAGYRGEVETTEPLPFGIYGEVLAPGAITVGDPVALQR